MKVPVNKIIPFSAVDGPGNRTAVFLQGCNFNCKYCHNPETINECINCGYCVERCPKEALSIVDGKVVFDWLNCVECDLCIKNCPHGASPRIQWLTPEEVYDRVQEQMPFIRGITVSGGECSRHPEFLTELFRLCKKGNLHTLVDSNGSYDFISDEALMSVMDGLMLDIKAWDEEEHRKVTGVSNKIVKDNLIALAKNKKLEEVRTVVVPGLFDYEQTVIETGKALAPYLEQKSIRYKLIAYRPMGVREKYANFESPSQETLNNLANKLRQMGFQDIIII